MMNPKEAVHKGQEPKEAVDAQTQTTAPASSWLGSIDQIVSSIFGSNEADGAIASERETHVEQSVTLQQQQQQQQQPQQQQKLENRKMKSGYIQRTCNKLRNWVAPAPIPQNSFIDVEETEAPKSIIYRQAVARNSDQPHPVKFQNPKYIICGVACVPKDEKTASPEVLVLNGGVGHDYVELLLSPVAKGYWACAIEIMGTSK